MLPSRSKRKGDYTERQLSLHKSLLGSHILNLDACKPLRFCRKKYRRPPNVKDCREGCVLRSEQHMVQGTRQEIMERARNWACTIVAAAPVSVAPPV